jgi:putative oxidoreductase
MLHQLIRTRDDYWLALLRLCLGIIFLAHGCQKVLGWWGGYGLSATMNTFTQHMGIPAPFFALAIAAEFLGGIGLILGFLTRIAAFGIAVDMLVALFLVHIHNGFFMNWAGNQHGEGFEYHLMAIAIGAMLIVRGAGAWSLDRLLDKSLAHGIHYREPLPHHG